MSATCLWPVEALLGEGPVYMAKERAVWFVDIVRCQIHRFDTVSGAKWSWTAPSNPGFLAPKASGGFIVGLRDGLYDFKPETGNFELRQRVDADQPGNRLNDGHVDAKGRLWFGTMDDAHKESSGSLWRYDERGLVRIDPGYRITNGPALSPDGHTLYHTDTIGRTIYAFDVDDAGDVSNKRVFANIDRGFPDGPVVDAEGCVWSALYGGWGMNRYAASGKLISHIEIPCANVTKAAFGGDDVKTLYVTTARQQLNAEELAEQPLAGGLFTLRVAVPGLPQAIFHG